ncbi:MAG: carbohydrate ABC transporter permease [Lachnospiraceae bacterium]|nr:carbohydrate ABC transporter permease [Lachnospiraceae bacterium]
MKKKKKNKGIRHGSPVFDVFNYIFLGLMALICIMPIINVLAISFSQSGAAAAGRVTFWPVGFNLESYRFAFSRPQFITSFWVSIVRTIVGLAVNMTLTILAAYPLSRSKKELTGRNFYAWFFFITIVFNSGLVPWYLAIRQFGLINSFWALILPGAMPVFNAIILMNFFKQLPDELSESAAIDGAGHFTILFKIFLPVSLPPLATVSLFSMIYHWNDWFSGLVLLNDMSKHPLQTYLQSIIVVRDSTTLSSASRESLEMLSQISDRTLKSAQIFIAALPILAVYPFLQKYFMKGLVMGSVKG